ncbi:hypothetical protein SCOR_35585 [Sulfidibacter corallicola]|uniref:Uncharacterized protein n=1 Tax=Sulfidibacter corallicola TaxID=2818388 RepID=A0A8A4THW8_SULCO|nr:hypothetical protein [Sulfidibacter corallicola]QTD49150.1 hypothetical protein J3U87_26490 [Sulfidibacter corallicola]
MEHAGNGTGHHGKPDTFQDRDSGRSRLVTAIDPASLGMVAGFLDGLKIPFASTGVPGLERLRRMHGSDPEGKVLQRERVSFSLCWLLPGLDIERDWGATVLVVRHPFEVVSCWHQQGIGDSPLMAWLQEGVPELERHTDPVHRLAALFVSWYRRIMEGLDVTVVRVEDSPAVWAEVLSLPLAIPYADLSKLALPELDPERLIPFDAVLRDAQLKSEFFACVERLGYQAKSALTHAFRHRALTRMGVQIIRGLNESSMPIDVVSPELTGALVLNVGARDLESTRRFLEVGAQVVVVDPDLGQAASDPVFSDPVVVEPAAVIEEEGEIEMYSIAGNPARYRSELVQFDGSEDATVRVRRVHATTLTRLINHYGMPNFVRLGIPELTDRALTGLKFPVELLIFHFHRDLPDVFQRCLQQVERLGFSEMLGFDAHFICGQNYYSVVRLNGLTAAKAYFDSLATGREGILLVVNRRS